MLNGKKCVECGKPATGLIVDTITWLDGEPDGTGHRFTSRVSNGGMLAFCSEHNRPSREIFLDDSVIERIRKGVTA